MQPVRTVPQCGENWSRQILHPFIAIFGGAHEQSGMDVQLYNNREFGDILLNDRHCSNMRQLPFNAVPVRRRSLSKINKFVNKGVMLTVQGMMFSSP
jgi:hypothetical protein